MATTTYRWLCYAPTYNYRPMPIAGISGEPENAEARGLIAYSYHEYTAGSAVPVEVFQRMQEWLRAQQRAKMRLELLPMPAYKQYWDDNKNDLRLLLKYLAIGVVAVAVVAAAIYFAPLMLAAGSAAISGIAGAFATASELTAVGATGLVTALSMELPDLMRVSQSAVNTALAYAD